MRVAALEVFDDIISGTTPVYTPAHLNETLGAPDVYAVQACASLVGGTSTAVVINAQVSGDGNNWVTLGSLVSSTITNDGAYCGSVTNLLGGLAQFWAMGLARIQISLTGTSPSCRLKVYFTGRSRAAPGAASTMQTGPALYRP